MTDKFKVGQKVQYESYGQTKTATIVKIGKRSGILFIDNKRWLHPESASVVPDRQA